MGSDRCVTCGQAIPGPGHHAHGPEWLDLGLGDDPWGEPGSAPPSGSRRPRLIVGGIVAVLGLIVAWRVLTALVFGDNPPAEQATPLDDVIEEASAPEPETVITVATFFTTEVDQDDTRYAVAMSRAGEVEVLSADGLAAPEPKTATTFAEVGRFPLFSDGQQTWGINPADPAEVLVASANYRVVKTNAPGGVAYMKPTADDQTRVGVLMFGVWNSPELSLSPADRVIPVDGLGVIVVPETGGSFLMANSQLAELTSDNILDATPTSAVLRSCTETLACATVVVRDVDPGSDLGALNPEASNVVEVEIAPGNSLAVSPDGQWIATWSRTGLWMLDTTAQARVRLASAPPDRVAWAPDSSFVTWTSAGKLQFSRPEARDDATRVATLPLPDATYAQSLIVTAIES